MESNTINVPCTCPSCNKELVVQVPAKEIDPLILAPNIRGNIMPVGIPYEYKVSSEDIKKFITDTCHRYSGEAKLEISPRYCEKKRRKDGEPHRSYSSFMIAFSHHIIDNYDKNSWFERLGETDGRVTIISSIFKNLIERWSYNPKQISEWLKSYKKLEKLEDGLGMTESFINEIKEFSVPRSQKVTGSKDSWVFFMASPEKILRDFFSNPVTNELAGELKIKDIVQISRDIVEYTITLNPYVKDVRENPHVRQILSGELKG